MSIGNCRFIYSNVLDNATFTVSSVRTGLVTSALKNGTGSASLLTTGNFTGATDLEYTVEIDSVSGGTEIGQATFRWTDAAGTWDATGVTTSTAATALNNGISIKFSAGSGADFALNDKWYFKAVNRFSPAKMVDRDRDTRFRSASASSTVTIVADLGSAQTFNTIALMDHNLSASATITLEANATDSWGAPSFSQAITYGSGKLIQYLSAAQTYRYARLSITDTSNADGYIEIGAWFLSSYLELSRSFRVEHSRDLVFELTKATNRYGVTRKRFHNSRQSFSGSMQVLTDTDMTSLRTMMSGLTNTTTERILPLVFHFDSEVATDFFLMEWEGLTDAIVYKDTGTGYHTVSLDLIEVAKTL